MKTPTLTRKELIDDLGTRLGSRSEATWIIEDVLGSRTSSIPNDAFVRLNELVERRIAGEPLQYLLGHWSFREIDLIVDGRVLIPRPETEQVVEVALAELARTTATRQKDRALVVDIGTGSGSIALSISAEAGLAIPGMRVVGTDVDADALELARENLERVSLDRPHCREQVEFFVGDLFGALGEHLKGQIDLVVSNPPYVDASEWPDLDPEVRREPLRALLALPGSDGTLGFGLVEHVVESAPAWLSDAGVLVVEIAPHQSAAALLTASNAGFRDLFVVPDLAGRERALVARK
ncbi:MAG: peptide chain release factor N(5)-glutamine methyltransferase [Acidimicrobiales bacterium]